jgi:hypothetical protein
MNLFFIGMLASTILALCIGPVWLFWVLMSLTILVVVCAIIVGYTVYDDLSRYRYNWED